MNKKRSIWKNLGWALAATPMVSFIVLIIITLVGALDDAVTKAQMVGYWWLILVGIYILSLLYFICQPTFQRKQETKKLIDALVIYWKEQLEKQEQAQPSDSEIKIIRGMLIDRIKIWAWSNPELWTKHFPDEQYSKYLFGLMDNFITHWEKRKATVG